MAAEDKILKLQQYQRTKQLIHDLNFDKAIQLPMAAGAEGSSLSRPVQHSQSWIVRRAQDSVSKNDMSLVEGHVKVMNEMDPANPYYSNLLDRISHGDHINWKEFEDAVSRFSSNEYYLIKLQDAINDANANLTLAGEAPTEIVPDEIPVETAAIPPTDQPPAEPARPPESSPETPSAPQPTHIEPIRRPTFIREVRRIPQTQKPEELKQNLKQKMQRSQGPPGEPRPRNPLPTRTSRISSQTRKKITPKLGPKLAPKIGTAAALGGGGGAASGGLLGNLLGARGMLQAGQWLANKFGLQGLGRLLGNLMPEKLIAQGLRGLWNVGTSFGRAAFDGLIRNAFNLAPRGIGSFGGGGLGSFFSGAAATTGAILTSAIFWWVIAFVGLFVFVWWYDQFMGNSECNKPTGEMRIVKRQGGIGSLEVDPTKIEAAVPNGQKIDFVIEASYQLACRTRTLSSVVVTDRVPEGTEYIEDSAISGFYQTNGEPIKGVYDASSRTLTWSFTNFPMSNPVFIYFSVQPGPNTVDTWVMNEARVRYTEGGKSGLKGGTIDVQSPTLQAVIDQAAQRVGMEPALMKAFLRVEAQAVLNYSEEEFQFFSTPGWWEGLVDNASTREGNDPTIVRGYGYNTCAYMGCAAGADVRGVAQFEAKTWEGIAKQLSFSDGHTVDRRIATDAIFGSALLNRENAEYYTGSPNFEWTEEVIRAAGRIYCGGKSAARRKLLDGACMQDGKQYEDLLWGFYLEYSGK